MSDGRRDARPRARAEEGAGGAVGVGEPALRGQAGEGDRELVEEVVGDEARDLGAVQRHQEEVAGAVVAGDDHGAHRLAAAGEAVDAVGPERQVGEQALEGRLAVAEGGGGGIGGDHGPGRVDAEPGDA